MKDKITMISEADLNACEEDMKAFCGLAVSLVNHCMQVDPDFKNSWLYMRAKEVLGIRESDM